MSVVHRSLTFDGNSIDVEKRTAQIVWTTGAKVLRKNWGNEPVYEELDMSQSSINLSALNNKAPLLIDHNGGSVRNIVGVIESGSASISDNKGFASVRFGTDQESETIFQKVRDGLISKVSVGYSINKTERIRAQNKSDYDTIIVRQWTPHEVSLVVFPADPNAGVRSIEEESFKLIEGEENMQNTLQSRTDEMNKIENEETKLNLQEITKRERERISEIGKIVKLANLDDNFSQQLIDNEVNIEEARKLVFQKLSDSQKQTPYIPRITGGNPVESHQKRNDAITTAILHRDDPDMFKLDEYSARFKNMGALDIARYVTQSDNFSTKIDIVERALSTSDFPILLANVLNKKLRRDYQAAPKTYGPIVLETEAPDFKPLVRDQMGDAPMMKEKPENSEYEQGYFSESNETYSIKEYGKMIEISRKLIINDDMHAMLRLPTKIANRAAQLESDLIWGCLLNNGKMNDGIPIFDLKHKNYAGKGSGGGTISVDTMSAAVESMMMQRGLDGALFSLSPKYLIVPASQATKAKQFLHVTSPIKDDDTNPFKGTLQLIIEPRLDLISKTAWYLAADIGIIDLIEVAYLQGQRGLFMDSQANFNTDGIKLKCRMDIGAKVIDYRGFYKNEGVAS